MREDMSRVIVERPRLGGHRTRKGRARAFADLPKQEGMRRAHPRSGDWKTLYRRTHADRRFCGRQAVAVSERAEAPQAAQCAAGGVKPGAWKKPGR
jgi:hypothetical protein